MKSLHDYRGEHRAAKRRYHRAYNAWFRSPAHRFEHLKVLQASLKLTAAYQRLFKAEVAQREGVQH